MYEIQKDQSVPVKFFAGEYPVVTAVKAVAAGKSVKQYEPVKLTDNGIEPVVKVAASEAAITLPEGVTADTLAKAFRNIGIFLK